MKKTLLALVCLLGVWAVEAKEVVITSPDGNYRMTLNDEASTLRWSLDWEGKRVVEPSVLGIKAGFEWRDGLKLGEVAQTSCDTVWHPIYGERNTIRDRYNAYTVTLHPTKNPRNRLQLEVRAYE